MSPCPRRPAAPRDSSSYRKATGGARALRRSPQGAAAGAVDGVDGYLETSIQINNTECFLL